MGKKPASPEMDGSLCVKVKAIVVSLETLFVKQFMSVLAEEKSCEK